MDKKISGNELVRRKRELLGALDKGMPYEEVEKLAEGYNLDLEEVIDGWNKECPLPG